MSVGGFAGFMGVSNSKFINKGYLVSYSTPQIIDGFTQPETEDDRKTVNFAIVGPGDLKPRGPWIENTLTQDSLNENKETFSIVCHFSNSLYHFVKQNKKIKLEWDGQLYNIQSFENLGSHKIYLRFEIVKRVWRHG